MESLIDLANSFSDVKMSVHLAHILELNYQIQSQIKLDLHLTGSNENQINVKQGNIFIALLQS